MRATDARSAAQAASLSLSDAKWTLTLEPGGLTDAKLSDQDIQTLQTSGIPVRVPGNVYDALLDSGLIDDPFIGTTEHDLHWIGRQNWAFKATLPDLPAASHYELIAEGLDTVAQVKLGDRTVGTTENMHRTYAFDITDQVLAGERTLEVLFTSPYVYTDAVIADLGKYPGAYEEPYNLIRKMAANYGWDWGPTVVSSGIWRDLRVEAWDDARIASVRMSTGVDWTTSGPDSVTGTVNVKGSVELDQGADPSDFEVRVTVSGSGIEDVVATSPLDEDNFEVDLRVSEAQAWWPHTLGEQNLYSAKTELVHLESGTVCDQSSKRVGFRTIEIVNEPSLDPATAGETGRFGLVVNRQDTFACGWNWIPNDPLVDRVTEADYRARLLDVKDSGADWVRVWGGGIYEDDAFYDVCDEIGVLVWQDFPFSCASYPETEPMEQQVRAEAADNIERLMSHASLGIWNGNNENFLGYEAWGWDQQLGGKGWGGKYYLEVLPDVLSKVDPNRPYWPGSPYSGIPGQLDNDPNYGTCHSWGVWNQLDYVHYLDSDPTFMAEFGWQAPPAWSTLVSSLGGDPGALEIDLESPELLNHQKAIGGMGKLERGIAEHFGTRGLASSAAWHYLSQIVQARAVFTGVGHWRSLWPRCQGAFIWQINDCWPVISWAGVDVSGLRKPMWYAARRAFGSHLLYLKESDGKVAAHLTNQSQEPWEAEVAEWVVGADGKVADEHVHRVTVAPSSVLQVDLQSRIETPRTQMLMVDVEDQREVWLGVPDYDFEYPSPEYVAEPLVVDQAGDAFELTVSAGSLLRELTLQADRIHPALLAPTEAITLLPGEQYAWRIELRPDASAEQRQQATAALESADWSFPVLASVGDILAN